jgi:predicted RNA polymerase sigma factor
VPDNARGWLITVAARRLADLRRSDEARKHRETRATANQPSTPAEVSDQDDSLLLFMCCHPELAPSSAIPLTPRAVGGLSTAEIARAFLLPEDTIAKRITRTKQRIKTSGTPIRISDGADMAERLPSVLHVLYLIFNEGYAPSTGPGVARSELSNEAIRSPACCMPACPATQNPQACWP